MIFISHRGNIDGANPDRENHPDYILETLGRGFDVEIDVWHVDNRLCLGHDEPQYEVNVDFLKRRGFWCHLKNTDALGVIHSNYTIHHFWHQDDDYTITSRGYIWVYPGKELITNCIAVKPENRYGNEVLNICGGICSDLIGQYRSELSPWL